MAAATMPIEPTFWARQFGMLVDQVGIPWMINCDKPIREPQTTLVDRPLAAGGPRRGVGPLHGAHLEADVHTARDHTGTRASLLRCRPTTRRSEHDIA